MGTQQQLTTAQLKLLILMYDIEEFAKENEVTTSKKEIITQDNYMTVEDYDKFSEVLCEYGYITEDDDLTIDGRQYVELFAENIEEKKQNPSIVLNNRFSLINLEELNAGINFSADLGLGLGNLKAILANIKALWLIKK